MILIWSSYIFNAWVPLYAYPAEEAPQYKNGYKVNAALWGAYLLGIPVILWFSKTFPASPEEQDLTEEAVTGRNTEIPKD